MGKTEATFVFRDGPPSNTYIAPSGAVYRVHRGFPFKVSSEEDLAYFRRKDTCEEVTKSQGRKTAKETVKAKKEEASKDSSDSGFDTKPKTTSKKKEK